MITGPISVVFSKKKKKKKVRQSLTILYKNTAVLHQRKKASHLHLQRLMWTVVWNNSGRKNKASFILEITCLLWVVTLWAAFPERGQKNPPQISPGQLWCWRRHQAVVLMFPRPGGWDGVRQDSTPGGQSSGSPSASFYSLLVPSPG